MCPASSENLTTTFWATGGLSTFCLPSSSSHLVTKAVWPRNSCSIAFLHQEFTGVLLNLLFPQGHLTFPVRSLRAVSISENFHSPLENISENISENFHSPAQSRVGPECAEMLVQCSRVARIWEVCPTQVVLTACLSPSGSWSWAFVLTCPFTKGPVAGEVLSAGTAPLLS